MNYIDLDRPNRQTLENWLDSGACLVACLCAAWCDTCAAYKHTFAELAAMHPAQHFAWIDIEDQSDLVGDLDIVNFPTLLIQQGNVVGFFGTVQPDLRQAERLLRAHLSKSRADLVREANSTLERINWQNDCNLRKRLDAENNH